MFSFSLPFFSLLILFSATTTTAQPYDAPDHISLDCGSSTTSDPRWVGDEGISFLPSNSKTTSFSFKSYLRGSWVPTTPYSTARIFNASTFTYKFPVSEGPKFLRLYFYPTTYSDLNPNKSFFSVSSNGYALLTNFSASAFLTASLLANTDLDAGSPVSTFVKEFVIYVRSYTSYLDVIFTPSPASFAFINGIEIVSMPEDLYLNAGETKYVGQTTGPMINREMALENIYRLNMGGGQISGNNDTGMYRSWDQDDDYIYGASIGLTPVNVTPITYTVETPSYTAPELVYATQRSMGNLSDRYNLTWILPVDSGFYYMLRFHFCNIIPQYTKLYQVVFTIFINNLTADEEVDPFSRTEGSGYPVFKDYGVFVNELDGSKSKQDLWVALHPNPQSEEYFDGFLNGLEAFKMSLDGNLAVPYQHNSTTAPASRASPIKRNKKKTLSYGIIIGGVGAGLVLLSVLFLIVFRQQKQVKHHSKTNHKPSLPSDYCRRFTLKQVKVATNKFNDDCVIGNGGFGKVYKGYMDNATTTVAIKRLKESSSQGIHEFRTEIEMLSRLRHVNLVSLIGYCDENGEMILVYDYMMRGNLGEHLYKTNNPPLSWKTRLDICIGAAKGLHYLHTSEKHTIIHRDVKSSNILLDENWVAKVSDFGLSKVGSKDQAQTHVTTLVKGSIGYIDPEYCRSQHLREKSDVYSFGVVLFEVLCARPVIIPWVTPEQVSLAGWGKTCYQRGTLVEIIDPNISGEVATECLRVFGELANSCLHEEGRERPGMEEVVRRLELALQLQESAEKMGGEVISENPADQNEIEDERNVANEDVRVLSLIR